jgi:hypothetical protein
VPVTIAAANGKSSVRLALESNDANKTSKPTTFVDLAETIWRLLGEDKTQQQVADELGWRRGQVSNYALLQSIDPRAWNIVATTVRIPGCHQKMARWQTVPPRWHSPSACFGC